MGRPPSKLDWEKIGDLLIAGCSANEIAGYFGCSDRTIYERCETDLGILYSEYSQEKKSKGKALIRAHQFAKALGKTDVGDNTLLIWLGKTRLQQRESKEIIQEVKYAGTTPISDIAKHCREQAESKADSSNRGSQCLDEHLAGGSIIGQNIQQSDMPS